MGVAFLPFGRHWRNEMDNSSAEKANAALPGVVAKVIKPHHPSLPEKAEIKVEGADDLYKEIRIENTLTNENGEEVGLKKGAEVAVVIEADEKDTIKKDE